MTLLDTTHFPPGGYAFRQPEISLDIPPGSETAMIGLDAVAKAVQTARENNQWSGLDPSLEACLTAVKEYQCARFKNNPTLLQIFCGAVSTAPASSKPVEGCAGCGR